jgi:hypothetical protein
MAKLESWLRRPASLSILIVEGASIGVQAEAGEAPVESPFSLFPFEGVLVHTKGQNSELCKGFQRALHSVVRDREGWIREWIVVGCRFGGRGEGETKGQRQ